MKKTLLMLAAVAIGALAIGITDVKEVKASQWYIYDYGNPQKVAVKRASGETAYEYQPKTYTVEQVMYNLQLLDNINKIQEAELAARTSLEIANATRAQIENLQPLVAAKQVEVLTNPGLQSLLNEMTAQLNSLQSQYAVQLADYQAKQATLDLYRATLPTAGYDAGACNCLYGRSVNSDFWEEVEKYQH